MIQPRTDDARDSDPDQRIPDPIGILAAKARLTCRHEAADENAQNNNDAVKTNWQRAETNAGLESKLTTHRLIAVSA